MRFTKISACAGAAVMLVAITAGCTTSDSEGDAKTSELHEEIQQNVATGDPVPTETLKFGSYAEPKSLDPAATTAAGSTGGTEMINIYDSLTRYDTDEQAFVPHLAQALTANPEADTWTLQLRPGVTFSNGDVLDADAVAASQERYVRMKGPESSLWQKHVERIEVVDPVTVRYHLGEAWPGFSNILSTGPGMIVAESSGEGKDFTPIGAGPFVLEKRALNEILILKQRDGYWDGTPHIAELHFSYPNDQRVNLDSLEIGQIDGTLVLTPDMAERAVGMDGGRYVNVTAANNVAVINSEPGRPGEDVRVRRAMQLASNPETMMSKPYGDAGVGSSDLFPSFTRWHSSESGLPYDPDQARALLQEAKDDGFDGNVSYMDTGEASARDTAVALQAQLESVGFDVTLDFVNSTTDLLTRVAAQQDYDMSSWGFSFRESDPYPKMFATLHSDGNQLFGTATSPEMDELISELRDPADTETTRAVMAEIQQVLNKQTPFLNWGAYAEVNAWSPQVQNVTGASNSMIQFANAWIENQ